MSNFCIKTGDLSVDDTINSFRNVHDLVASILGPLDLKWQIDTDREIIIVTVFDKRDADRVERALKEAAHLW